MGIDRERYSKTAFPLLNFLNSDSTVWALDPHDLPSKFLRWKFCIDIRIIDRPYVQVRKEHQHRLNSYRDQFDFSTLRFASASSSFAISRKALDAAGQVERS